MNGKATRGVRIREAGAARRALQKQELRAAILQAASELFLEHGYDAFSLRQVAERIGYSPTTIYLYFQNKDDLLLAAVQEGFAAFDARLQAVAAATPDSLARIEALGRAYIAFGLENPALYRLMFMQRSDFYFASREVVLQRDDVAGASGHAVPPELPRTAAMELLSSAVAEAMRAGTVQNGDALITADVLWAGAHGLVSLAISPLMSPEHAQLVVDRLLQTLLRGVKT